MTQAVDLEAQPSIPKLLPDLPQKPVGVASADVPIALDGGHTSRVRVDTSPAVDRHCMRSAAGEDDEGGQLVGDLPDVLLDVRYRSPGAGVGAEVLHRQLQLTHAVAEAAE